MKPRTIFISAGHTNVPGKDRGAAANGYIEGVLTAEFRSLLVEDLRLLGAKVYTNPDSSALRQTINYFRNLTTPNCIVLDIHFNAASPLATGTETFVPVRNTPYERELAEALSGACSSVLGIPLRGNLMGHRGVKSELESHHGRLGWMQLTGENVLMEICFITNRNDIAAYQANKRRLAKTVAEILYAKAGYNTYEPLVHVVSRGDTLWAISRRYEVSIDSIKSLNKLTSDAIFIGQRLIIKSNKP